jgi:hypothetical protein
MDAKLNERHRHHSREKDVHEQIANRHLPLTTEGPPTRMITTPTAPMISEEKAVVAETPVIALAILRKSLCAPARRSALRASRPCMP